MSRNHDRATHLDEVVSHLAKWEDLGSCRDAILQRRQIDALASLSRLLWAVRSSYPLEAAELGELFEALPDDSAGRILRSPEVMTRLSRSAYSQEDMQFLRNAMLAEHALTGKLLHRESLWTALGDFYVLSKEHENKPPEQQITDFLRPVSKAASLFAAPLLGCGTPVDFIGPQLVGLPGSGEGFCCYTPETAKTLVIEFDCALEIIERASPEAYSAIQSFMAVAVFRQNPTRRRKGSRSTPQAVGRAVFDNPHLDRVDGLADGLVHETIHQVLYIVEGSDPLISADVPGFVTSPWSGASLRLHAFSHACFVWYGLVFFWRKVVQLGIIEESVALSRLKTATKGFDAGSPADLLEPFKSFIAPADLSVLDSLRDHVLQ